MTDIEITKLCAEAMGLDFHVADIDGGEIWVRCPAMKPPAMYSYRYNPLCNDAQAMELLWLLISTGHYVSFETDAIGKSRIGVCKNIVGPITDAASLRTLICVCVAKMEQKKREAV